MCRTSLKQLSVFGQLVSFFLQPVDSPEQQHRHSRRKAGADHIDRRFPCNADPQVIQPHAHIHRRQRQQQPDNAAASNNRAESLIRLQRFEEARSAIARAVKLQPNNGEILLNAAGIHALLRDDKTALFFLKKAMANGITPEMISMHRELVSLSERPEFMEYYKSKQSKKQPRK